MANDQRKPEPFTTGKAPSALGGPALTVREEYEELTKQGRPSLLMLLPSWLSSLVLHMIVLMVLALVSVTPEMQEELGDLFANASTSDVEELKDLPGEEPAQELQQDEPLNQMQDLQSVETESQATELTAALDADQAPLSTQLSDIGLEMAPVTDLLGNSGGSLSGDGLEGRGDGQKKKMLADFGGTEASEAAVQNALEWLARHQNADGSWSFDHRSGACKGECRNPGDQAALRTGATGMALLPFLGAGNTHKEGKYKKNVQMGLFYLSSHMKLSANGGDLQGSGASMYSHGIATIALCEAYAMTKEKTLFAPAQQALNFIVYAQDPVGGGWRYGPRQRGDTSVVGWQLMALKSGNMGYLAVPPQTIKGAVTFLNSVQADSGAFYGYTDPGQGQATTAIGLLCRMYLGWNKDNPALQKGVKYLSDTGPSTSNMYFNYYATQVLRHYEGPMWDQWNTKMRDFLVGSQARQGHEKGSWFFAGGDHGASAGGRHYCTCMATMILEVYYRHLPLYRKKSTDQEFND